MAAKIRKIKAREILDSRGIPTIEVSIQTDQGISKASVPSGTSRGRYEAFELRDGGKRYFGKGVLKAIKNINEIIAPKLIGKDATLQKEIDRLMIELDGTENKSNLGGNAICAVSLAVCKAGAAAKNLPLFLYISDLFKNPSPFLPFPCFNILEGGAHAGNNLAFQEFMVLPEGGSFSENLRYGVEVYQELKRILKKECGENSINYGQEGGFSPPLNYCEDALFFIEKAIKSLGYQDRIKLILDCAASQFFKDGNYEFERKILKADELLDYYSNLVERYPIFGLEDPFSEDDWNGFQKIEKKLGNKILIIGDDLLVTNPKRILKAQKKKACNCLILKINQIGTVSEVMEAAKLAKSFGWKIIVSHRSGETEDPFISDFAVGISANFIKAGAPARERATKYNRLLEIEEELSLTR